eukprot:PhM_4_TR11181/c0_g1_i1/m.13798
MSSPSTTTSSAIDTIPIAEGETWAGKLIHHILTPGTASSNPTLFSIINVLSFGVFIVWAAMTLSVWSTMEEMRVPMIIFGMLLAGFVASSNYVFAHLLADDGEGNDKEIKEDSESTKKAVAEVQEGGLEERKKKKKSSNLAV